MQHRGRVEAVEIDSHAFGSETVRVLNIRMSGGCQGCAGAKATVRSIVTDHVSNFDPTISYVKDITDHTNKTNAFFKE